jgi:hypothetical protein
VSRGLSSLCGSLKEPCIGCARGATRSGDMFFAIGCMGCCVPRVAGYNRSDSVWGKMLGRRLRRRVLLDCLSRVSRVY